MSWLFSFTPQDWQAIGLTIKLAVMTTLTLLVVATPLAWWLAHTQSAWQGVCASIVALPLVLPPTVLGFYLLVMLGPHGPLGQFTQWLGGSTWAFTFKGLLIGSVIYSMPFAVQPLQQAFVKLGRRPLEVAATLGASPWDAFWSVALPQCRAGFLTAVVLTFAHTVGEFGVVLMIGGNVDGVTRVVSTQIFGHVEAFEYAQAHALAAAMLVFSFVVLWLAARVQRMGSDHA